MSEEKSNISDDAHPEGVGEAEYQRKPASAGLVSEPEAGEEGDGFEDQLQQTLRETEEAVGQLVEDPVEARSWQSARELVENFKPVPWFIWRLSHFVLSKPGQSAQITEGLVFGLRRLMFAAGSDPVLGAGEKVNRVRKALDIVPSDVVAAVSVIHAVCRRLSSKSHERVWRPILDDAVLRARMGFDVGSYSAEFGPGRGMLAGFAGRCGLVILIASGELEQAQETLESLARGEEIQQVGLKVYGCDPLQVSAMTLSASGCGRDAAFGTAGYAARNTSGLLGNQEQNRWLAAFTIIESMRTGHLEEIDPSFFEILGVSGDVRSELAGSVKLMIRRGHGWNWLVG